LLGLVLGCCMLYSIIRNKDNHDSHSNQNAGHWTSNIPHGMRG